MTTILDYLLSTTPNKNIINKISEAKGLNGPMIDLVRDTIMNDNNELFNTLMELNLNINELDTEYESTLVMFAAQKGRYEMLETLIKKGADVGDDIENSKSALSFAISSGNFGKKHTTCVKILIRAGANIDFIKNRDKEKYYFIKELKNLIDNEDKSTKPTKSTPLVLVDKNGNTYSINNNETETKPTLTVELIRVKDNIILSIISKGELTSESKIMLYGDTGVSEGKLSPGLLLEIPNEKGLFHLLPIGAVVDGIALTKPVVCRFIDSIAVNIGGTLQTLNNIY